MAISTLDPTRAAVTETAIRRATHDDIPHLVAMAARFLEAPEYRGRLGIDLGRLAGVAGDLINNPEAVIFVSEREGTATGMLAMHVFDHPMSGERTASEVVWWVEPHARGCGLALLRAGEAWARAQGAELVQFVAPTARVAAVYRRLGYDAVEIAYHRRLS